MNSGILLVDKPPGLTSHDVVSRMRRLAGTRKVGHAGTLDPMATGVLLIGVNGATRLLHYFVGLDKEYFATIRLGWGTTTDDAEGEALAAASAALVDALDDAAVADAIEPLRGEIEQVPSSVSAVKIDGKRAYQRVRAGEQVEIAARCVRVSTFDVLAARRGTGFLDVDVRVECSSGTYIRALARDLGDALGVGGHLTALRRTRIGDFEVSAAGELDGFEVSESMINAADAARRALPVIEVSTQQAIDLGHGKRIDPPEAMPTGPVAAIEVGGAANEIGRPLDRLVAIVEQRASHVRVIAGFPPEASA